MFHPSIFLPPLFLGARAIYSIAGESTLNGSKINFQTKMFELPLKTKSLHCLKIGSKLVLGHNTYVHKREVRVPLTVPGNFCTRENLCLSNI